MTFPAQRVCYRLGLKNQRTLELGKKTCVMGILNVTPDSFSDGGKYLDREAAIDHALEMVEDGADIIDIGGESTRPGSDPVPISEEVARVTPVIEAIRKHSDVPISIDTQKAEVAERALEAGADIVNDVSAFRTDPKLCEVVAEARCPVVLMHMLGTPKTMQQSPTYRNVVEDVRSFLYHVTGEAINRGVDPSAIVIDPGIGFGKRLEHNLALLQNIPAFASLGFPVLIGTSRKSMIGMILNVPLEERLIGTMATVAYAVAAGAHIVRVHDVPETVQTVKVIDAIVNA